MSDADAKRLRHEETEGSGSRRARSNAFLASYRIVMFVAVTIYWYIVLMMVRLVNRESAERRTWAQRIARNWFKTCVSLIGLRVTHAGPLPASGSTLAPNHTGYGDIFALGSIVDCVDVAKSDMFSWPLFGTLMRASEQIAVRRARARGLLAAAAEMKERLEGGQSVCVFLEGTSSGGTGVLPFHGSMLQPAIDARAPIVPVALRWHSSGGGVDVAEDVAYWKDHVLVPHVWRFLGLRGIEVEIVFGAPIASEGCDRSTLAAEVERQVLKQLEGQQAQVN
jgi:1-acyl-sn-glycerol-3-phosphate acyltransferase